MRFRRLHKLFDPEIRKKNIASLAGRLKENYWRIAGSSIRDPIFIVGCSRSGTTITYETVRSHPMLVSFGYEIPQFWHGLWGPNHNDFDSESAGREHADPSHRARAFAHFYARTGNGWLVDKTCINVLRIPYLITLFPNAKFIYVYRDGRDNVSSLLEGWKEGERFALRQYLGELPAEVEIDGGRFKDWCFFLPPGWRDHNEDTLSEVCAYQWVSANEAALASCKMVPAEQWIGLAYEDIVRRPVDVFVEIFDRLELQVDDVMMDRLKTIHSRPTSIVRGPPKLGKWRQLNSVEIRKVSQYIAPLQIRLGYDQ